MTDRQAHGYITPNDCQHPEAELQHVCETCGARWAAQPAPRPTCNHFPGQTDCEWCRAAQPAPLDGLGAAQEIAGRWGGTIMVGFTDECQFCSGWWATASKRDPEQRYPIILSSETGRPRGEHHGETPAAAIAVLVAALRAEGETK